MHQREPSSGSMININESAPYRVKTREARLTHQAGAIPTKLRLLTPFLTSGGLRKVSRPSERLFGPDILTLFHEGRLRRMTRNETRRISLSESLAATIAVTEMEMDPAPFYSMLGSAWADQAGSLRIAEFSR